MKRFLLALAAIAILSGSEAQAAQRYYYRSGYNRPQGPFARMMELERRKNAWLRATFLGG